MSRGLSYQRRLLDATGLDTVEAAQQVVAQHADDDAPQAIAHAEAATEPALDVLAAMQSQASAEEQALVAMAERNVAHKQALAMSLERDEALAERNTAQRELAEARAALEELPVLSGQLGVRGVAQQRVAGSVC